MPAQYRGLLIVVAVLLVVLFVLARGMRHRARAAAARAAFESTERVSVFGRGLVAGAVIVGGQWLAITYAPHDQALFWVVLAVPAAVAGLAVVRTFTVVGAPRSRRDGGRR